VEVFTINHLNFAYPEQEKNAISDLTLSVRPGEFLVLCGPSGCGKSTLLRQMKTVLAPHGRRSGEILFEGRNLDSLDQREQAEKIGFVQQSPENQIVTDKVWHELAFGLESMGLKTPEIRTRVSEMASFFGIQTWFHKKVTELSGGQKQRLCIARALLKKPKILILDDSTSAVDTATDAKIRKAFKEEIPNTTKLIIAQRISSVQESDKIIVLNNGKIESIGTHEELLKSSPIYKEVYESQTKGGEE